MNRRDILRKTNKFIVEDIFMTLIYLIIVVVIIMRGYLNTFFIIMIVLSGIFFLSYTMELIKIIVDILKKDVVNNSGKILYSKIRKFHSGIHKNYTEIAFITTGQVVTLKSQITTIGNITIKTIHLKNGKPKVIDSNMVILNAKYLKWSKLLLAHTIDKNSEGHSK